MRILCKSNNTKLQAGQQVNRVGKYLYKNLDGAFNIRYSSNMCDVYLTLLYQLPVSDRKTSQDEEVQEMTLDLNITTYQNKVRVNIIEISPEERTIGFDVYSPELMINLKEASQMIFSKVVKKISKAYQEYDFIF